jgi:hypothetical protein
VAEVGNMKIVQVLTNLGLVVVILAAVAAMTSPLWIATHYLWGVP